MFQRLRVVLFVIFKARKSLARNIPIAGAGRQAINTGVALGRLGLPRRRLVGHLRAGDVRSEGVA